MNKKFDLKKFFLNPWVFFFGGFWLLTAVIGAIYWIVRHL